MISIFSPSVYYFVPTDKLYGRQVFGAGQKLYLICPFGVRQDVMPLRRGNSEMLTHKDMLTQVKNIAHAGNNYAPAKKKKMLTHEDTLTLVKAYALTGEYSAHADKDYMLTQVKENRSRDRDKPLTRGNSEMLTHKDTLTRATAYTAARRRKEIAHAGKNVKMCERI